MATKKKVEVTEAVEEKKTAAKKTSTKKTAAKAEAAEEGKKTPAKAEATEAGKKTSSKKTAENTAEKAAEKKEEKKEEKKAEPKEKAKKPSSKKSSAKKETGKEESAAPSPEELEMEADRLLAEAEMESHVEMDELNPAERDALTALDDMGFDAEGKPSMTAAELMGNPVYSKKMEGLLAKARKEKNVIEDNEIIEAFKDNSELLTPESFGAILEYFENNGVDVLTITEDEDDLPDEDRSGAGGSVRAGRRQHRGSCPHVPEGDR